MKQRFLHFFITLLLLVAGGTNSIVQAMDKDEVVASFEKFISRHISSYNSDDRSGVSYYMCGGSDCYRNVWYEVDPNYTIDLKASDSLISPYIGICKFKVIEHLSKPFAKRSMAVGNYDLDASKISLHTHVYAFQRGKWVVVKRTHLHDDGETYDCNETIQPPWPDAGKTDIYGCFEKPLH